MNKTYDHDVDEDDGPDNGDGDDGEINEKYEFINES